MTKNALIMRNSGPKWDDLLEEGRTDWRPRGRKLNKREKARRKAIEGKRRLGGDVDA